MKPTEPAAISSIPINEPITYKPSPSASHPFAGLDLGEIEAVELNEQVMAPGRKDRARIGAFDRRRKEHEGYSFVVTPPGVVVKGGDGAVLCPWGNIRQVVFRKPVAVEEKAA